MIAPLAPSWHLKSIIFLCGDFFWRKVLDFKILAPTGRFCPPPGNFTGYAAGELWWAVTILTNSWLSFFYMSNKWEGNKLFFKYWHNPKIAPAPMGLPMLKHWQLTWPCCSFRQQRRGLFHDIAQIFRFTIIREIRGHSGNPAKSPHYECKPAEKALEISVQSSYSFA